MEIWIFTFERKFFLSALKLAIYDTKFNLLKKFNKFN